MTSTPVDELAETFTELAGAMAAEHDLEGLLDLVADRCVRLLDVPAAGVLLVDHGGRRRAIGASDERARQLVRLDDGPPIDCYRAGLSVVVTELARVRRHWPAFVRLATAGGLASALAVPMRRGAEVVGSLTLFRGVTGEVDKTTDRVAQALAELVTIGLLQARTLRRERDLAAQLQHALSSRVVIEQAKGVVSERLGLSMEAAFSAVRRYARSHNVRITDLALSIVDGEFDGDL